MNPLRPPLACPSTLEPSTKVATEPEATRGAGRAGDGAAASPGGHRDREPPTQGSRRRGARGGEQHGAWPGLERARTWEERHGGRLKKPDVWVPHVNEMIGREKEN
jgi:hypothetical protein